MKKVLSVVLALLMLCSLALIASAEPRRFSVIDNTYANATRTIVIPPDVVLPFSYIRGYFVYCPFLLDLFTA